MIKVELLTMPGCGHCASAKETVKRIKGDFPDMVVEVIDITEHPEAAQMYMLMSAPGIIINGKLEFSGGVKEDALRKRLKEIAKG
ncbi:MAG: thioredoxin family protein [Nitrospirae bacterium]|nr:thioredoxin family protein [Nitrospirota bacterium]